MLVSTVAGSVQGDPPKQKGFMEQAMSESDLFRQNIVLSWISTGQLHWENSKSLPEITGACIGKLFRQLWQMTTAKTIEETQYAAELTEQPFKNFEKNNFVIDLPEKELLNSIMP